MNRGHKVYAYTPNSRKGKGHKDCPTLNPEILEDLENKGILKTTPSKKLNGVYVASHDDNFILGAAKFHNAVIVSTDQFRKEVLQNPNLETLVHNNLLHYQFAGDFFQPSDDPFGKNGPTIEEFLNNDTSNKIYCPCPSCKHRKK